MGTARQTQFEAKGTLVHWHGRSGRDYPLLPQDVASFAMDAGNLYLIAKFGHPLWVGSSEDLVADAMSRVQFRLALASATEVYRLESRDTSLLTICDLQDAVPAMGTLAQAA